VTSFYLDWLPDETVFSLCSRFHVISGHSAAHQTTRAIFQHHRTGSAHDLPSRLEYFAARFDGRLGSAREISVHRTILPFYLLFRSAYDREMAITTLCSADRANIKYRLGLLTSNQGASHPLKACSECIKYDGLKFGCSYWHVSHQLPGSAFCLKHQLPLIIAKDKTYGFHRFQWILPHNAKYNADEPPQNEGMYRYIEYQQFLQCYANAATAGKQFERSVVGQCCDNQIRGYGFVRGKDLRMTDWAACVNDFLGWLAPLYQSPYIENVPDSEKKALLCLQRTVRPKNSYTHPLNTLLVLCWLFRSWRAFACEYLKLSNNGGMDAIPSTTRTKPNNSEVRQLALKLLDSGSTARATATSVGVDTQTVICWGKAAGISLSTKPHHAKLAGMEMAKAMLSDGVEKSEIEKKSKISHPTINRLLRSDPDLQQCWEKTRLERRRNENRNKWLEASQENPTFTTKHIRLILPEIYAWLYRNDRDWLLEYNETINVGSTGNNSFIRWDDRDYEYANQIKKAAYDFSVNSPGIKISRHELLRKVPNLAKKLRYLSRLPLTNKAFEAVIKR
jgi:hypothetical protein